MNQNQLLREALADVEQAHDLSLDLDHYASRQVLVSLADKIKVAIAAAPQAIVPDDVRTDPAGDWSYSHDEERFSGQFNTKEEAIAEAVSCGAQFVGRIRDVREIISDRQIGCDIYERIGEILGDEIGEVAELFTMTKDECAALGKVVMDWIESGPGFHCWGVDDVEPIDAAALAAPQKAHGK